MKHTEEQVLEKAKKILIDLFKDLYNETDIRKASFNEKKELIRGKDVGKTHPCWTISINAPFDNIDFLAISDETGEPLYYMNFNTIVYEIGKDPDGNYFRKEN